ncbi:hypothetical protein BASA81_007739 [Batrachochytrium salamandrivorans]|nr:hypothetical protein BASA81_007739 [Batrachochytrium salamandrivorans]
MNRSVALVTGGSRGLGKAVVDKLSSSGFKGVISFDLAGQRDLPNNVTAVAGDVSSERDVLGALETCKLKFGEYPRVVVNCAGVCPSVRIVNRKLQAHDLELFSHVLKVNVVGSFNVLRLCSQAMLSSNLPKLSDGQLGVIVNTASIAAYDGQIGQAAYAASKGAIASMTLPAARDLAQHGIRVVTIAPGVFNTPMVAALPEAAKESLAQQIPFPSRLGDPKEFAHFIVSGVLENIMLNGEVVRLDGALRMGPK